MKKFSLAAGIALAFVTTAAGAQTYDVAADYGSPIFSYGTGSGGSIFTSFGAATACGTNLVCYGDGSASIAKNTGATPFVSGTVVIAPGTVHMHPGAAASGADAILRFIAPTAGTYSITGNFRREDTSPGSGDGVLVNIFSGNSAIFTTYMDSLTYTPYGFSLSGVTLASGGILDFVVGNFGGFQFDSTAIAATIQRTDVTPGAVPEPATWALLITGFGMVGASLRRRRRSLLVAA